MNFPSLKIDRTQLCILELGYFLHKYSYET